MTPGRAVVDEHLVPGVVEMTRDHARDLEPVRRVRVRAVDDPAPWLRSGDLDQRRDVGGGGRMVGTGAAVREEDRGPPVEDALDEDPLPRAERTRAVHLRRADHGHRVAARRGRPAPRPPCSRRSPRGSCSRRRSAPSWAASRGSGRRSRGPDVGVRVVAGRVDVDRLARQHHGRSDPVEQRQHEPRLVGRVADVVHEQVGALADHRPHVVRIVRSELMNRAPSTASRGSLRPVRSTSQPPASSRRATATPT